MATITIKRFNWMHSLEQAIQQAQDGDVIIVHSEADEYFGEHAKKKLYPEKKITFQLSDPISDPL